MVSKSMSRYLKIVGLSVAALLVLVTQAFALAQTPAAEVEIVGTATSLTVNTITVGVQSFDISRAEVKAGVRVGELVKIHASQNTSGQWIAREVELAQAPTAVTPAPNETATAVPANEFELTGVITAVTTTTLEISGHTIDISTAEVKNSLAVNDRVKVHVIIVNGEWIAREVESASIPVTLTVPANCTAAQPDGWVAYTVQAGDTLSGIAIGSGSTLQAVAAANCITNPRSIRVGQTVFVPQLPTLINGHHNGQDDGPGHDLNDDHGGNNATDDHGSHSGSDDQKPDDNNNNRGGSDSGSDHHGGSDDSNGHG